LATDESLLTDDDKEKLKRSAPDRSPNAPFRWEFYSFPQPTFSRSNYSHCSCGNDFYLERAESCSNDIDLDRHEIIHGWVTRQMCQKMPWLSKPGKPIAPHLISMFVTENGSHWTEEHDTSEYQKRHDQKLRIRKYRIKQKSKERPSEQAKPSRREERASLASISSQSCSQQGSQQTGLTSTVEWLRELFEREGEKVASPLGITGEWAAQSGYGDATIPDGFNPLPTNGSDVSFSSLVAAPNASSSNLNHGYCTMAQLLRSADDPLDDYTEYTGSRPASGCPSGSHRLSLPWDTSVTQGCRSVTTAEPEPVNQCYEAPPDPSADECDGWIHWLQDAS
jgi:hypothetical protein